MEEINTENAPVSPVPQSQNIQASSNKKNLFIILAIFLFLISATSGAYFLGAKQNKNTNLAQKNISTTPQPSPTTTIDDTANLDLTPIESGSIGASWKTYVNEKYGYELKYPDNLIPVENNNAQSIEFQFKSEKNMGSSDPAINIAVSTKSFSESPNGNISKDGIDFITNWEEITIGKIEAHSYTPHQCAPYCPSTEIDIPYKNGQQTISIKFFIADKKNTNQILSTFRFAN